MSARSIPNLLGLFRIVTTPVLVALILSATPGGYIGAVVLLLLMAISDAVVNYFYLGPAIPIAIWLIIKIIRKNKTGEYIGERYCAPPPS